MSTIALFGLLLAAGAQGPGEGAAVFELDPVTVTAEGLEAPLDTVTAATVVITAEEIRARGLSHVAELLREVAGVELQRQGSLGKATTARLRGGNANQTLVLVDGAELNSPTLGLADLADLSVDNIERIEVVRGPQSALYGSEAIGGVIRVITRRGAAEPELWGSLEGGGMGTLWVRAGGSGGLGERIDWSFGVSRLDSDGQQLATPLAELEHDGYGLTTLSGRLDATLGSERPQELSLSLRWSDGARELPIETFGAVAFDPNATQDDRQLLATARWASRFGRWRPRLTAGFSAGRSVFDDPADPDAEGFFASDLESTTETDRQTINWANELELHSADTLLVGLEWERRAGSNSDNFAGLNFDQAFETTSLFVSNRLELDGRWLGDGRSLALTAGVRLDDVDSFGSEWSPKLGGLLQLEDGLLRLRANYAEGFRAPSINELAFPFFGNPELRPESSRGYELGVGSRFAGGRGDVELRYVHSRTEDLIVPDPETFQAVNLDVSEVDSVELEGRWLLAPDLYLRGSYTWTDAVDALSGEQLLRQPEHRGALSLAWQRERWRLAGRAVLQGGMHDVFLEGLGDTVEGWQRVDLSGAWRLDAGGRFELSGVVENLFDADYQELNGFPAPGLSARLGLRLGL